jgi:hypothetical protein
MPPADPRSDSRRVTLPQVLALMAIWTAVIYGVTAKRPSDAEQISLKEKPALVACAKQS